MSTDITMQAAEADVADSLLGDNIIAVLPQLGNSGASLEQLGSDAEEGESQFSDGLALIQQQIEEDNSGGVGMAAILKHGDAWVERKIAERGEQEPREQRQARSERLVYRGKDERPEVDQKAAQQEIAEPSAEQVREAIQQLDAAGERFQLNEDSREFADKMAPLLGPEIYKNEALLSNTVSRYTIAARDAVLATNGDLSKLPPLSPAMANEASRAVAMLFGMNPQENPVYDEMHVANTMRFAIANLINTHVQSGGETDVTKLNHRDMAVLVVQNLVKGLTGEDAPVNPQWAIQFVNSVAGRVLPLLPKIKQGLEGATQQPRAKGHRGQRIPAQFRDGIKGSRVPKRSEERRVGKECRSRWSPYH